MRPISNYRLSLTGGVKAIATVLSVDMRKSTERSKRLSAKAMYETIHTFIGTVAKVVRESDGEILNYRGDGMIALFGRRDASDDEKNPYPDYYDELGGHLKSAAKCGKALIETSDEVLEPLFEEYEINDPLRKLQVGVGIAFSEIVLTKIGLDENVGSHEVTGYGDAVNHACKLSDGNNEIYVTNEVDEYYPQGKGGKIKIWPSGIRNGVNARYLEYNKIVLED